MRILEALAKACAIAAGLMLTAITLLTCASLVGRNLLGQTLAGDFELVGAATGAAIALFLPWCQMQRGNIIVSFVTARASRVTREWLDRIAAFLFAAVLALLTWRSAIGGINAWNTQAGTMMMGFPEWIIYGGIVPPLALCTLIGLGQAVFGFATEAHE